MPRFIFRLEATDGSGHFRRGAIFSDSEEEARRALAEREFRKAMFRLTTDETAAIDQELDELAAVADGFKWPKGADSLQAKIGALVEAGVKVPPDHRAAVAMHEQAEPYELVHLGKSDPPRDPKRRKAAA